MAKAVRRGFVELTDCPEREDAYTIFHLVGDIIGLLDALGERGASAGWSAQACDRADAIGA